MSAFKFTVEHCYPSSLIKAVATDLSLRCYPLWVTAVSEIFDVVTHVATQAPNFWVTGPSLLCGDEGQSLDEGDTHSSCPQGVWVYFDLCIYLYTHTHTQRRVQTRCFSHGSFREAARPSATDSTWKMCLNESTHQLHQRVHTSTPPHPSPRSCVSFPRLSIHHSCLSARPLPSSELNSRAAQVQKIIT